MRVSWGVLVFTCEGSANEALQMRFTVAFVYLTSQFYKKAECVSALFLSCPHLSCSLQVILVQVNPGEAFTIQRDDGQFQCITGKAFCTSSRVESFLCNLTRNYISLRTSGVSFPQITSSHDCNHSSETRSVIACC